MFVGHGSPRTRLFTKSVETLTRSIAEIGVRFGMLAPAALPTRFPVHSFVVTWVPFLLAVAIGSLTTRLPGQDRAIESTAAAADKLSFELRIVWGGGKPRAFRGSITIDSGTLNVVRNLSLQPDSVGAISNSGPATLKIESHSLSTFGGVDLMIDGNVDSQLTFRIDDAITNQPVEHTLPLNEILQGNWIRPLDSHGSRLAAERQMHDRIRVQSSSTTGILAVGASWHATASGYHCGLPAGDYLLATTVVDEGTDAIVGSTEVRVSIDPQGNFTSNGIELSMPTIESAYTIEMSLQRKRFLPNLVSSGVVLTRRLDCVTFDYSGGASRISTWTPVATINPLNSQWWTALSWISTLGTTQTLTQFAGMTEAAKRPVSHGAQGSRELAGAGYLTLSPGAWQAYPLRIAQAGQPHRLRVRVPNDRAQQLVISIRDFHRNGEPTSLNVDSGIVLTERQIATEMSDRTGYTEHEIIFWPRSEQPYVLMLNASAATQANFGELSLDVGQLTSEKRLSEPSSSGTTGAPAAGQRSLALYLSKPLLADALGAQRNIDPVTRRPLESWLTWHQSATRLTQYMQSQGYNTLVFNVISDGAAVFPSSLSSTRRFDTGTFYADSRAPELKDLVELLCCHLDRAGLQLVLAVDLNSHLPGLAKWESEASKNGGLYQVNIDGSVWKSETELGSRRVLYNPLHPQVQSEIERVIRDISSRYATHPSFGGLALELGESSHLIFAGDRWGYDESTLSKFEAATQSKLPSREVLAEGTQAGIRLGYLNWRAAELSSFYIRLANAISQAKSTAKLLINPLPILERRPAERDYVDPNMQSRNLSDYWLAAGLDGSRLKKQQNIVLLRGKLESPLKSGLAQAWLSRIANDSGLANAELGNATGMLLAQRPVGVPIDEANKLQHSALAATAWCYPQVSSLGSGSLQSLVALLHREDALFMGDGGLMPIQGDSPKLQQLRQAYLALPNVPMRTFNIDSGESSVRVRSVAVGNVTYLQMINAAPWSERITMDVHVASSNGLVEILGGRELKLNGNATQLTASSLNQAQRLQRSTVWQFELPPFDMVGVRVSDPQFQINSVMHSPDPAVVSRITQSVEELEGLMAVAADPAQTSPLRIPGGDFENWIDGSRPSSWTVSSLPQVVIRREDALPHSGQSCLALENRNNAQVSAWIQSEKIGIPESGRLAVEAWVRSSPTSSSPILMQLSVIGRTRDGRRFQRSHQFGTAAQANQVNVDWGRKPIVLYISDLPSDELAELHVAFDLVGPGKIWLDDIQAYEPLINPDERVQIRGQLFLAREKLRENNPFPAEQALNSHWARYLFALNEKLDAAAAQEQPAAAVGDAPPNNNTRWSSPAPLLQQWRESMRERWQR